MTTIDIINEILCRQFYLVDNPYNDLAINHLSELNGRRRLFWKKVPNRTNKEEENELLQKVCLTGLVSAEIVVICGLGKYMIIDLY